MACENSSILCVMSCIAHTCAFLQNVFDDDIQCVEYYSRHSHSNPYLLGCYFTSQCLLRLGTGTYNHYARAHCS